MPAWISAPIAGMSASRIWGTACAMARKSFYESGEQLHGALYELWQKGDEHFDEARNEVGELLKKQRQYLDERLSKRHEELKACFEEDRHALD